MSALATETGYPATLTEAQARAVATSNGMHLIVDPWAAPDDWAHHLAVTRDVATGAIWHHAPRVEPVEEPADAERGLWDHRLGGYRG